MASLFKITPEIRKTINEYMKGSCLKNCSLDAQTFVPAKAVGRYFKTSEGKIVLEIGDNPEVFQSEQQQIDMQGNVTRIGYCHRESEIHNPDKMVPTCEDWEQNLGEFDSEKVKVLAEAMFPGFIQEKKWTLGHQREIETLRKKFS